MDAKIQELERQAIANNDEMLAYRVVIEKERLHPIKPEVPRNQGRAGHQFNPLDISLGAAGRTIQDGGDEYFFYYEDHGKVDVRLSTSTRATYGSGGPVITLQKRDSIWVCVGYLNGRWPLSGSPYSTIEEAKLYALNKFLILEKEREKEVLKIRSQQYIGQIRHNLKEEQSLLFKLQRLRKEIGSDYLELAGMEDRLNVLGGD